MPARAIVTAPVVEPITFAEAKANSRLGFDVNTDESVVLETAAVLYVDGSTFTVAGDKRGIYGHGRYLELDQTTDQTGYVAAAPTYDSGTDKTTIIFSGAVDAGLDAGSVSYGDVHLAGLLTSARATAEHHQDRMLITQTWDLYFDGFPAGDSLALHAAPIQSVTSIKYTDSDGAEHTMDAADYAADTVSIRPKVKLAYGASWPTATLRTLHPVVVRVVAGYGAAPADVPYTTRAGMLLLIATMFEHREEVVTGTIISKMPRNAEHMLDLEAIKEVA